MYLHANTHTHTHTHTQHTLLCEVEEILEMCNKAKKDRIKNLFTVVYYIQVPCTSPARQSCGHEYNCVARLPVINPLGPKITYKIYSTWDNC